MGQQLHFFIFKICAIKILYQYYKRYNMEKCVGNNLEFYLA